jgi:hypothetical protein
MLTARRAVAGNYLSLSDRGKRRLGNAAMPVVLAQPTPSAEDRFLALSARS